ncbi:MAG: hypothetical protein SPH96_01185, partial [Agathobacter sp.]|nr:hypothetical protein [Agathobacter sp.]
RFDDLTEENKHLLDRCEIDMHREHYDDDADRFISDLFEEDKARLLPLYMSTENSVNRSLKTRSL